MDKPIKSTKTLVLVSPILKASPILRIVKAIAHQQSLRSPIHIEMWRPLTTIKGLNYYASASAIRTADCVETICKAQEYLQTGATST